MINNFQQSKASTISEYNAKLQALSLFDESHRNSDLIKKLKTELIQELKVLLIASELTLNHVTTNSSKDLNGKITAHENSTMYNESYGKYIFASVDNDGKLLYAARAYNNGMIRIGDKEMIVGSSKNLNISENITLKRPVYCYKINPKNIEFEPVVTIKDCGKEKPEFLFEDEWIINQDIEILPNIVKIEKLDDITELLATWQIYTNETDDKDLPMKIRKFDYKKRSKLLEKLISKNKTLHLNQELKKQREKINNFYL